MIMFGLLMKYLDISSDLLINRTKQSTKKTLMGTTSMRLSGLEFRSDKQIILDYG